MTKCRKCRGKGNFDSMWECQACHGEGYIEYYPTFHDRYVVPLHGPRYKCEMCHGHGEVRVVNDCSTCHGKGRVPG